MTMKLKLVIMAYMYLYTHSTSKKKIKIKTIERHQAERKEKYWPWKLLWLWCCARAIRDEKEVRSDFFLFFFAFQAETLHTKCWFLNLFLFSSIFNIYFFSFSISFFFDERMTDTFQESLYFFLSYFSPFWICLYAWTNEICVCRWSSSWFGWQQK